MAEVVTQINQPPEFIESESKLYLDQLRKAIGAYKGADLSKIFGPQFTAGQDPLQLQAQQLMQQGIGGYQKYLNAAEAATGPNAYKAYMSPYQQDVIDTTLSEYDVQARKGAQGVPAAAIAAGAFGGGREGVQRAEYQSNSDRNRAGVQANLLQQGFGQANQLAQQNYMNQLNLGQSQQQFLGQDIGALATFGAQNQAQNQAQLTAQQQLATQQMMQPLNAAQQYGSGIMGLISGYPGGTTQQISPSPSAAQTGIGIGTTLAGLYKGGFFS
tara:strand:+ start:26 stop:838 length:813 start_codon:yes stop_codon:yes gene_type:complete